MAITDQKKPNWEEDEEILRIDPSPEEPADEQSPVIAEGSARENKRKRILGEAAFYVGILAAALFLWRFVLLNAQVPTGSMENTIMSETRIMGLRCAYWFSEPERGDIIVFYAPDHRDTLYVKRVIGLPGETVQIIDGQTYIDGVPLKEDYLPEPMVGSYGPYQVPEGGYFMMGDNRNHSADAREWTNTYVYEDDIIGKAYFSYWPKLKWID